MKGRPPGATVEPRNDPPAFASPSVARSVVTGALAGTAVGAPVTATDVDGDTLDYTLTGTSASLFNIDSRSARITVASGAILDANTQSSYTLTVTATDPSGAADTTTLTITVTPAAAAVVGGGGGGGGVGGGGRRRRRWSAAAAAAVGGGGGGGQNSQVNRPPQFREQGAALRSIPENSPAGTPVGTPVTAVDPNGDAVVYRLTGADRELFAIDPGTGQITVGPGTNLDYEKGRNVYRVRVSATDPAGSGRISAINVIINVTDVNENQLTQDEPPDDELAQDRESAQPQPVLQDIELRDHLVANQEALLNVYRCMFDIDTHIVPGGCTDNQPGQTPAPPAPFQGTPTQDDSELRDRFIAGRENLLNAYRCMFDIDTHIVHGGCRVATGET